MVKGEFSFWDQKLCGDFLGPEKNFGKDFSWHGLDKKV